MPKTRVTTRPNREPEPEILPPEAEARIERALRLLRSAIRIIDKQEQCGEECQDQRRLVAELEAALQKRREVYFPRGRR